MTVERERDVTEAFVALANSLVGDFDIVDLLSGLTADCARLLDIASAGVLLVDRRGDLHVIAASSDATRDLELYQIQRDEGPCLDCYHSGEVVTAADLEAEHARWPLFVDAAVQAGFRSVHAVPMRLQDSRLGTLGLFGRTVGALGEDDLNLAQALAHVGSVAITQGRATREMHVVRSQLQNALNSRVVLEQAKGVIAQRAGLDMDQAFGVLRDFSRDSNQLLTDVAAAVVARTIPAQQVIEHAQARHARRGANR